jgi:hypothetical protein
MSSKQSPAERVADSIATMQEKMNPESGYREVAVEYGVFTTGINLEIQEQTAEQSAQAAYKKRVATAHVEANASEQDKLALRNQRKARAEESKSIQSEVNPKSETDPDKLLNGLEALGISLNKKQSKQLEQAKSEASKTGTDG